MVEERRETNTVYNNNIFSDERERERGGERGWKKNEPWNRTTRAGRKVVSAAAVVSTTLSRANAPPSHHGALAVPPVRRPLIGSHCYRLSVTTVPTRRVRRPSRARPVAALPYRTRPLFRPSFYQSISQVSFIFPRWLPPRPGNSTREILPHAVYLRISRQCTVPQARRSLSAEALCGALLRELLDILI